MSYADLTTHDRNPIKRWMQRRRFHDAVAVLKDKTSGDKDRLRILDFGAGDGELVLQAVRAMPIEAVVYEPTPALMAQAKKKLSDINLVTFTDNLTPIKSGFFDYVFCLEVFEHLPPKETLAAIKDIHRLLKPNGVAVIGVPHELFIPAFLKGLFRLCRRYGDFDANPKNIFKAFLGNPPSLRPTAEIAPGFSFHFHHLGFDHRALKRLLLQHFQLEKIWFSPFPILGSVLNSEVYFLVRKVRPSNNR